MIWDVKATNMVVNGRFYHRRYHVVKNWRQLVSIGVNLCQLISIGYLRSFVGQECYW